MAVDDIYVINGKRLTREEYDKAMEAMSVAKAGDNSFFAKNIHENANKSRAVKAGTNSESRYSGNPDQGDMHGVNASARYKGEGDGLLTKLQEEKRSSGEKFHLKYGRNSDEVKYGGHIGRDNIKKSFIDFKLMEENSPEAREARMAKAGGAINKSSMIANQVASAAERSVALSAEIENGRSQVSLYERILDADARVPEDKRNSPTYRKIVEDSIKPTGMSYDAMREMSPNRAKLIQWLGKQPSGTPISDKARIELEKNFISEPEKYQNPLLNMGNLVLNAMYATGKSDAGKTSGGGTWNIFQGAANAKDEADKQKLEQEKLRVKDENADAILEATIKKNLTNAKLKGRYLAIKEEKVKAQVNHWNKQEGYWDGLIDIGKTKNNIAARANEQDYIVAMDKNAVMRLGIKATTDTKYANQLVPAAAMAWATSSKMWDTEDETNSKIGNLIEILKPLQGSTGGVSIEQIQKDTVNKVKSVRADVTKMKSMKIGKERAYAQADNIKNKFEKTLYLEAIEAIYGK